MYGPDKLTMEMHDFCKRWAEGEEQSPLTGLNEVDRYFKQLWDTSHTTF
jgi:hypothetical protein